MHFLHKTVGILALLAALPAAEAATARPAVVTSASRRMPTMTATINTSGTTTSTTTSSSLLANTECIDAYTDCIKAGDACGQNFEECTTKVLFHSKMPQCLSTLAQCASAGVTSLFGTSAINALSNVASKNSYGEVTDYTYPTDGSVLGQMITAAAISNRYDTGTCVKRYTSCLQKDNVCGADFELCTTSSEFRKQRVYCESTLARCQSEGLIQLFGSTNTSNVGGRVADMIREGGELAAVNAVSTCYKVADQCILNACADNPHRCYESSNLNLAELADAIKNGTIAVVDQSKLTEATSRSSVSAYIKNACYDTIGSNKYCYATFLGNGVMPTASQLKDEDNQEEIFDAAITSRLNTSMKAKIKDLIDKFDTKAKTACTETIKSCVMRTCGSGSGAACYVSVFNGTGEKTINKKELYTELETGCAAIINTDANCQYAAANPDSVGTYTYSYINNSVFDTLFPSAAESDKDPIGVVASLNASLQSSFNEAAIAQMEKRCENLAKSCVRNVCGTDYAECYRNRTDVTSTLTNTGTASYDNSMNKVGGVLDYTVILGRCLDQIKNSSACEEHLKIEQYNITKNINNYTNAWSSGSSTTVRSDWLDAGSATSLTTTTNSYQARDENGEPLCYAKNSMIQGRCDSYECDGQECTEPVTISETTYAQNEAANTLFKRLVYDLEKEAQALYNAKLTKQQNQCYSLNEGGIIGNKDLGSSFQWVKLTGGKIPKDYSINGLKDSQMRTSNDLYGSFCRARITLKSDDKTIQEAMKGKEWTTRYFAVGDAFTCGSWIPSKDLEQLAKDAADKATAQKERSYATTRNWVSVLGALGLGTGGMALSNKIQGGGNILGLNSNSSKNDTNKKWCENAVKTYKNAASISSGSSLLPSVETAKTTLVNGIEARYTNESSLVRIQLKTFENAHDAWKNAATDTNKKDAATAAADALKTACDSASDDDTDDGKWDGKKFGINVATGAATAVGGYFLVNKLTKDIQRSSLDKAHQEAYDAFMEEIGSHIQCYVGSELAGEYGDTLSLSLE